MLREEIPELVVHDLVALARLQAQERPVDDPDGQ